MTTPESKMWEITDMSDITENVRCGYRDLSLHCGYIILVTFVMTMREAPARALALTIDLSILAAAVAVTSRASRFRQARTRYIVACRR